MKRFALAMLPVGLAVALSAQSLPPNPALSRPYGAGYNDGYTAGLHDHATGYSPNSHKFQNYQAGNEAYRGGFDDGYHDGYAGRHDALLPLPKDEVAPVSPAVPAVLVPAGTTLQIALQQPLSSATARAGDRFTASVATPVWLDAQQAIPAGSLVQGAVERVARANQVSGHAHLQLQYDTLQRPGEAPVALHALTAAAGAQRVNPNEGAVSGPSTDNARNVAERTTVFSALGGIFGGYGGLWRGALAGVAVGAAGMMFSRARELNLPAGETLQLRLTDPLPLGAGGA